MAVMMSFGVGTTPALSIVAKLINMGWLNNRAIIYPIGTVLVVLVGLYFILQGI